MVQWYNVECAGQSKRHLRPVPMLCNSRRNALQQPKEPFLTPKRRHRNGSKEASERRLRSMPLTTTDYAD